MKDKEKDEELLEDLPRHLSVKLLRFVGKDLRKFWRAIRATLPQASQELKEFAEQLPEIFAALERDDDLRNRREVYLNIARFLQEKFSQPLPISLNAVHILCQENDPQLLDDAAPGGSQLIPAAKELILTIKVHYEPQAARMYNRQTEIYFIKEDLATVKRFLEPLDWDSLPQDVRSSRIRQGIETLTFKLYPKEK